MDYTARCVMAHVGRVLACDPSAERLRRERRKLMLVRDCAARWLREGRLSDRSVLVACAIGLLMVKRALRFAPGRAPALAAPADRDSLPLAARIAGKARGWRASRRAKSPL